MANGTIPMPLDWFDTIVAAESTNSALTLNFTDNSSLLLITAYNTTNKLSAYIVFGRSSGVPLVTTIASGSAISVDSSVSGKLTLTASSGTFNAYAIPLTIRARNGFTFS